jgi:glycosyltransferase involved in cell wall biosynthesis/GT2 family glycosyltransferase
MLVSVVIPTHNRPDKLPETLRALAAQNFDDFEIIVVDDGSHPPADLGEYSQDARFRLLRTPGIERSAARNLGAKNARGEYLVFLDDDITTEPDFLQRHYEAQREWKNVLAVGGIFLPDQVLETPLGKFRHAIEQNVVPQTRGLVEMKNFCAAANMSITRTSFEALGGFDEDLRSSEDQDLALRHTARGGVIAYLPDASVLHRDGALDIRSYCKRWEWGSEYSIPFAKRYADFPDVKERERINSPVNWGRESKVQSVRKIVKNILASPPVVSSLFALTNILEKRAPASPFLPRFYSLLLGAHILRGYRRGREKFGAPHLSARDSSTHIVKKTILHFAEDKDTSGFLEQLARWHDRERYHMIFATLRPMEPRLREKVQALGVECWSCNCHSRKEYGRGLLRLQRFLQRRQIDILHTHLFDPSVVGLLAGTLARTPLRVLTRHYSNYHTRLGKKWHVKLDQMCTRLAHRVICVSQHTADDMMREENAPPQKLRVIHNGIDFNRAKLSSEDAPKQLRDEFAPDGEFLMLQVSRFHPEKGQEWLFRALPEIKAQSSRAVKLLLAGTGTYEDEYRALVKELDIENEVVFLGFRRDAPDLMKAADLVVHPATAEAFGLVITEALYLGTPVVASRIGGIPEIVDEGKDGLLVEPENPSALAAAILKLIEDDDLRARIAGAGREKVLQKFSFQNMMRAYEGVYDE